MKSFFGLELEVQELAGESRADDAAGVGLNGPLRGFGAGCSLAVAPPGIGRQSLHTMKTRVTACWNICCIGVPFITTDLLILTTWTTVPFYESDPVAAVPGCRAQISWGN